MTSSFYSMHHGDCIQILKQAPSETIDMVLTDPPYICRYKDKHNRTVANDNNSEWISPAFAEIARVMKPNTICVSFYGWGHVEKFMTAWRDAGLTPIGHLVWAKDYASKKGFLASQHEQAYLLAKGHPPKPETPMGDVRPWQYSRNVLHPTQKAVEILTPLLEAFCKPNGIVLDPFAGSASTGVAAARTQRRFVGIEMDQQHFETACGRLKHAFPINSRLAA